MAVAVLCASLAACEGPDPRPSSLTLSVAPKAAETSTLRVRMAPDARPEDAEAVQARLTDEPVATRSVLRWPFNTLDVTVADGGVAEAVDRLEATLAASPVVAAVERCPCPDEAPTTPSGNGVHRLKRACSVSTGPRRAAGCVEEFVRLQSRPVIHQPGNIPMTDYALLFDASAWSSGEHRVRSLEGRVTSGEGKEYASASSDGSMMVWKSPLSDQELPSSDPTVSIHLAGFEQLDERARFSPGRVRSWAFSQQAFHVTSLPDHSAPDPARLKGAVVVGVPVPGTLESDYQVVVEYG